MENEKKETKKVVAVNCFTVNVGQGVWKGIQTMFIRKKTTIAVGRGFKGRYIMLNEHDMPQTRELTIGRPVSLLEGTISRTEREGILLIGSKIAEDKLAIVKIVGYSSVECGGNCSPVKLEEVTAGEFVPYQEGIFLFDTSASAVFSYGDGYKCRISMEGARIVREVISRPVPKLRQIASLADFFDGGEKPSDSKKQRDRNRKPGRKTGGGENGWTSDRLEKIAANLQSGEPAQA